MHSYVIRVYDAHGRVLDYRTRATRAEAFRLAETRWLNRTVIIETPDYSLIPVREIDAEPPSGPFTARW